MKQTLVVAALLIAGLIPAAHSAPAWDDASWSLKRDAEGISIWTMREDGHPIDTYKAQITLAASLDQVIPKLINVDEFANWAPDIREAYKLDQPNASYIAYDMPFPVQDRDMAQQYHVSKQGDKTIIVVAPLSDAAPEHKKRIRVQDAELVWTLIPSPDGTETTLQTIGYTDPEGEIPPFIINMLLVEGPFRTLKALRASLQQ